MLDQPCGWSVVELAWAELIQENLRLPGATLQTIVLPLFLLNHGPCTAAVSWTRRRWRRCRKSSCCASWAIFPRTSWRWSRRRYAADWVSEGRHKGEKWAAKRERSRNMDTVFRRFESRPLCFSAPHFLWSPRLSPSCNLRGFAVFLGSGMGGGGGGGLGFGLSAILILLRCLVDSRPEPLL